jgi:hypothetical protein
MKLETFSYSPQSGWSVEAFPALDSEQTLVIVFGASEFFDAPDPIRELGSAYPKSHLVGCSSSGEIFGTELSDGSLSVAVMQLEQSTVATVWASVPSRADSYAAGQSIARELDRTGLVGVLVLSDGLLVNGTELVQGINALLPPSVVVTGGLSGDGTRFQRTWVLKDGVPQAGLVCAIGFYGERLRIGHGSRGGWDMFGPDRVVTRSDSNVLYVLDDEPALHLYKKYLGDRATGLPATGLLFPLAIRPTAQDERRLVRTILSVDEDQQSMTFAGDIPEGWLAHLMKANFDRLVEGASHAAQLSHDRVQHVSPTLSIAISCVGRRLVLGERIEEETEAVLDILPKGTRQIGFYSYGEISPYTSGHCDLHNQTMTLTTISEA